MQLESERQQRQAALRADFERKVEEAASMYSNAEEERKRAEEAARKEKQAAEQAERDRMQQSLAEMEEKRAAEVAEQSRAQQEAVCFCQVWLDQCVCRRNDGCMCGWVSGCIHPHVRSRKNIFEGTCWCGSVPS